ncbi:MAG: serine hydrolase domain-containing protein, partial [Micromonosporaceae bacterium]
MDASTLRPEDGDPGATGLCPARLDQITAELEARVAAGEIPGAAALVHRGGHTVWQTVVGHRDAAAGQPMTGDAIFRIYSLTKSITGLAALSLRDSGHLDLDEPCGTYLPELADLP